MEAFDEAIRFNNLYKGLKKSAKGVTWKDSVAGFLMDGLRNTRNLRNDILNDTYELSQYQTFKIHEPKEREIVATRIRDRQFQRSLCDNVLTPAITRSFIYDNGACLKGKGVDFALNRLETHLHRHYRKFGLEGWVLECDIHHFFPETRHDVAKAAVRKRVNDTKVLFEVEKIIDSFGGDKGIALGSQVSQLIQLAVLDDLDHYIKERMHISCYVRYNDDFRLIHHDKGVLIECLEYIKEYLAGIGLRLNNKTRLHPLHDGIPFLQWTFILTDTGKVIRRVGKRSITKERRKLKKISNKILNGELPSEKLYESFQSWRGHIRRGDTWRVEQKMTALYNELQREVDKYDGEHRVRACKRKAAPADCRGKGEQACGSS